MEIKGGAPEGAEFEVGPTSLEAKPAADQLEPANQTVQSPQVSVVRPMLPLADPDHQPAAPLAEPRDAPVEINPDRLPESISDLVELGERIGNLDD